MPSLGTPGGAPAEKEKREQLERNVIEMAERMYGYIPPAHKEKLWIDMPTGQNIAGDGELHSCLQNTKRIEHYFTHKCAHVGQEICLARAIA